MIVLSQNAAAVLSQQVARYQKTPDFGVRVKLIPGTCKNGHEITLECKQIGDVESHQHGLLVMMDPASAIKLHGTTLDFRDTPEGAAAFYLD